MMIELTLRRRRASDRSRSSVTQWVGRFEAMEPRVLLTGNGLVGVPAIFGGGATGFPQHNFAVTSVPEDPGNTGVVTSTTVTAVGNVVNPAGGSIRLAHLTTLEIDAIQNGTTIGSVTWNVAAGNGTTSGPSYFGQGPLPNEAVFSVPFTFQSSTPAPQNVTFQIHSQFGALNVTLAPPNTSQLLTGTFVVHAPPTVTTISQPSTPRTDPVQSVDVTFSQPIDPTTFTTTALTLTRDGTAVPLASPPVTFTSTDNTTFTVGGLSTSTTPFGAYVLTVDATQIKNSAGTSGTGSQSVSFTVQSPNAPLTVDHFSPITSPRTTPVSAIGVTFSKPIDPTTFTTADLTLTRDGTPVPLGSNVTITTTDDVTFSVGGLTSDTTPLGSYGFTVNAAGVTDRNGIQGTGSKSITFVVQAAVVDTGPRIVALQRFGIHQQPPMLVITFDRQLDTNTVGLLSNYLVFRVGHRQKTGAHSAPIPILTGYYNSANTTVTLVMAKPLPLSHLYQIVVKGTGPTPIKDLNGVPLDGKSDGQPGTDFTTTFGREILAGIPIPNGTIGIAAQNQPLRAVRPALFRHYQLGS
jgi:hypothetical protein